MPVEELSCSQAAAGGQTTERVGVSLLAGWESVRKDRFTMQWQK